jgi:Tfp pilus assembly protein PilO
MNLAPRERRTILIGLTLAVVVGGYAWVIRPLARRLQGTGATSEHLRSQFADARTRLGRYEAVGRELKSLTDKLHVEVPKDSPPDQMKQLVEKFEQLAGRANVQIRNITQLKSQARTVAARGASPRTELKIDLTCQGFAGLARFVDSLEEATVPIVVDQISITTTGGRSGGGGGGGGDRSRGRGPGSGESQRRQLQAALKVYTYLFPERAQQ